MVHADDRGDALVLPPGLAPEDWPYTEEPIQVPRYPSKGWARALSPTLTVDRRLWDWFCLLYPSKPNLLANGNGTDRGTRPETAYIRFSERMPTRKGRGVKHINHDLARLFHELTCLLRFKAGVGPEPDLEGPPVGVRDDNPTDLRPSNLFPHQAATRADGGDWKAGRHAPWSLRLRLEAVLAGQSPDAAMAEAVASSVERAAERGRTKGGTTCQIAK